MRPLGVRIGPPADGAPPLFDTQDAGAAWREGAALGAEPGPEGVGAGGAGRLAWALYAERRAAVLREAGSEGQLEQTVAPAGAVTGPRKGAGVTMLREAVGAEGAEAWLRRRRHVRRRARCRHHCLQERRHRRIQRLCRRIHRVCGAHAVLAGADPVRRVCGGIMLCALQPTLHSDQ
eukprot:3217888-Prymnesium_polylepis.1